MAGNIWDERYAGDDYHFGTAPNAFLASQLSLLKPGMRCLAAADGEGRNGVWLAEQGLHVTSMDSSPVASVKAQGLAQERGVELEFEVADLLSWDCGEGCYDVVVAIFIAVRHAGTAHAVICASQARAETRRALSTARLYATPAGFS